MVSPEVVFHPEAAQEYVEALLWYGERGVQLREAFEQEVARALRLIVASPERWPRYGSRHRRLLVRRFPYMLVYLREGSRLWIVAVAHGHRRPGYWRRRRI
jgi:plasmid stabilization system protein ParE